MEILTGEQMRRIDRRAIEEIGIPGLQLMEAAGSGVAERLLADFPSAAARGVVILCGKGSNGGDGLVAGRRLSEAGVACRIFLLARGEQLVGDAAINLRAAREAGLAVEEIPEESAWGELRALLLRRPIVVDALLGTGVRGGARGAVAQLIHLLNGSGASVVAIDLPSGVDADSVAREGPAVRAERTYTLCRPKVALLFPPAAEYAGAWCVIPIGIPDEVVRTEPTALEWLDAAAAAALLPVRPVTAHKGDLGHLLAVAGSRGKSGAAVLLARGALRCGVGLVTVATGESVEERIGVQQAEMMTAGLPETREGALSAAAAPAVLSLAAARDALAIGPGLGVAEGTKEVVRQIVRQSTVPGVLDADALNAWAPLARDLSPLGPGSSLRVLTPHPGEAARLLGLTSAQVQADRLAAVRELARITGAVVVLKGHRTLVCRADGRTAVNASGNAGMATGGTGDVLTGAVGAFLARGLAGWDAARLAVFAHGAAGDRAALERGEEGMIATDLVSHLPDTLAALAAARSQ